MRILFVIPPYPNRVSEYLILPSIELCIASSILKKEGHSVDMLDMKIDNMSVEDGVIRSIEQSPDAILIDDEPKIHCNTLDFVRRFRRLSKHHIPICLRGEIPSFIPQVVMERNPGIDFIVRFDDDYAFLKILNAYSSNSALDIIPNIAFRNDCGEVVVTKRVNGEYDLDSLPMPDRRLYNIGKYLERDTETIVCSSRGCTGHCLFCIKTRFEKFRTFSISRFCDEIEELLSYGFTSFFFSDDTFAFSDKRLAEFYDEVKRRDLHFKWTSNIRIKDINDYKISKMKEIGAYRVFVGIETINGTTQKTINKNLDIDLIRQKIAILKKYGMEFHASFILGNPGDTEDDVNATIDFVKEIKPTLVTFNLLKVYPGLDLFDYPEKYGIILPDKYWFEKPDWSIKVVAGTQLLPPEKLETISRRCLFEFISA